MATEALDFPRGKLDFRLPTGAPARRSTVRRLHALLRQWRRQHLRRLALAQVLAETSDPRLIEDAGFARPAPGIIDLWARALLSQHRALR
jgi:uncharacterized protein YjiS (DUF1127 family)